MPHDDSMRKNGGSVDGFWRTEEATHPEEAGGDQGTLEPAEQPVEEDKSRVIESLLFVSPEPLSVARISEITGIEHGAVREIINDLVDYHRGRRGGFLIREVAGGFGFYATPDSSQYIARLIKSQVNPRLTSAALETLAIVAYLQPVSRGVVAEIRGVQSEGVVKTLEERGILKEVGKGGPPGYPMLYGTTGRFLERFGLRNIEELPPLDRFAPDEEIIERIQRSLSWELSKEAAVEFEGEAGKSAEDTEQSGDSFTEDG